MQGPIRKNKKCDICSYATAKVSNLKKHMKVHNKVKSEHVGPLNCPDCDKSFEIKKYLTAHMKTHIAKDTSTKDGNKEKKKCSTCNYETYKNFNLKSHISFNSLRIGSLSRIMTIRKNSPKSSPRSPLVYM